MKSFIINSNDAGQRISKFVEKTVPSLPTGLLYKVREGQGHTTQESWTPDLTPALWAVVGKPDEAGTLEDPITAARGMEYEYGLYYKDPEDSQTYLCKREGEAEGNKIVLQSLPHELVGQYFALNSVYTSSG